MTGKRKGALLAGVFSAALAACVLAAYLTRDATPERATVNGAFIDRRMLDTARQVAPLADTPRERELGQEALRLADHELDQAFASAVREAAAVKPPTSGPVQQLTARIAQFRQRVAADQQRLAKLNKDQSDSAQVEVLQAQLDLDQDELEDAQQDLIRHGGDERSLLQQARLEHAEAQKVPVAPARSVLVEDVETLAGQISVWRELSGRRDKVWSARNQAAAKAASLEREHNSLEALVDRKPSPSAAPADDEQADPDEEDTATMLARLRRLADQRKTLTELDRRIQDCRQLAGAYGSWAASLDGRRRGTVHRMLRSLSLVFGVMLLVTLVEGGLRRAFARQQDHRRGHQQRFLVRLALRLAGLAAILLVIFGTPSQAPAIIGLATAGLTVVLKDFVVGFFGWFVLMGRNGVRAGDWVEINGVGGEVIEVGLFKTVLLEMGNWTNAGHPTGRRVSFMNGYAIEGHYFNFSTTGQWLWDELQVTVPATGEPYAVAERIRELVERETEADAQLAEQDWERITHQYGTQAFSARPSVDLRPAHGALDVQVRYITRGPRRYEVKSRLFREIVGVLHGQKA